MTLDSPLAAVPVIVFRDALCTEDTDDAGAGARSAHARVSTHEHRARRILLANVAIPVEKSRRSSGRRTVIGLGRCVPGGEATTKCATGATGIQKDVALSIRRQRGVGGR